MKPTAGDEVRVKQGNRVIIGRVLGTSGHNGSTRYVVRSTHSELVHATRKEIREVRPCPADELGDIIRASVLRDAVALGAQLPKRVSDGWRRRLGLL